MESATAADMYYVPVQRQVYCVHVPEIDHIARQRDGSSTGHSQFLVNDT